MRTKILPLIGIMAICVGLYGCNGSDSSESDAESTYNDMLDTYTLYTVANLYAATEDTSGTYILLQGNLHDISNTDVVLIDTDTAKTITCTLDSDIDLTNLQTALDNNSNANSDTVTIGGICYFDEDSGNPYLDSCDYYYINTDED